jgi:phosphoribosylaminoimidazolecarboxamide formyltransferase/IMP cyclohydrolase
MASAGPDDPAPRALLSVSDKTGLVDLARGLAAQGFVLLSTGGTAKVLGDAGLAVTEVSSYTGFPEMLDGRVKTLHPKVHAGILARRNLPEHRAALERHGIPAIDLVVVNLYPFRETVARPGCTFDDAIENIDIGGPAMVRAAAKNWEHVGVVVDPADYAAVLAEWRAGGTLTAPSRYALMRKAFAHTASYDGAVAGWLATHEPGSGAVAGVHAHVASANIADSHPGLEAFPGTFRLEGERVESLRYGENPHQKAAFYRDASPVPGGIASYRQLQGKALSYNNIADADAAWECVKTLPAPACVIVKHANPCGVAMAPDTLEAYRLAFATDPTSAFGGIIAFNAPVDAATVDAVAAQFVEVLVAPGYAADAPRAIAQKKNVRVLEVSLPGDRHAHNAFDVKRVGGGFLVQTPDAADVAPDALRTVTRKSPTPAQHADLMFAWRVARFVKSNAIVFAAGGRTLGIGAGQMSRVDSTRIAALKAGNAGLVLQGSVAASDAFFPFRDGLDVIADQGAVAVIQPGGSMRDDEVIAAADERGIAMVFTGIRHFRH